MRATRRCDALSEPSAALSTAFSSADLLSRSWRRFAAWQGYAAAALAHLAHDEGARAAMLESHAIEPLLLLSKGPQAARAMSP